MGVLSIPILELKGCVVVGKWSGRVGKNGRGRVRDTHSSNAMRANTLLMPIPCLCRAALRRRMPVPDDDDDDDEEENRTFARLEAYTEAIRSELLLVHALLDGQPDQVIIFKAMGFYRDQGIMPASQCFTSSIARKSYSTLNIIQGFSSSLVRRTSPDPSKPVLPSRAIIKSIDRIRGPFNPSNIDYIQKDLKLEEFEELLKEKQL